MDPFSGQWVIYASQRANRPSEFIAQPASRPVERCPFCAGHEDATPPAVAMYPPGEPSDQSWQVRVIPNRFPAVSSEDIDAEAAAASADNDSFFQRQRGYGVHEVIVESPTHTCSFTDLTAEQAHYAFVAYRDRLNCLAKDKQLRYGMVFKNCRGAGGATLEHTHSQLIATSFVPQLVEQELATAADYFLRHKVCIFCELLAQETSQNNRVVAATPHFVAFCPYAGRFPYETWILPRIHQSSYRLAKLVELEELSVLIQKIIRALEKLMPQAPYNYWIHTSPFDTIGYDHYHWHLELIPRISTHAGFEWGTGCFINTVLPEEAAKELRAALPNPRANDAYSTIPYT